MKGGTGKDEIEILNKLLEQARSLLDAITSFVDNMDDDKPLEFGRGVLRVRGIFKI